MGYIILACVALTLYWSAFPDKAPREGDDTAMGGAIASVVGLMFSGVALVVVVALMIAGPLLVLGGVAWLLH